VSTYGTQYTETEALLATQVGDESEAQRVLSEMTTAELQSLADACQKLRSMALEWLACGGVQL
jgi:hypothetical protein